MSKRKKSLGKPSTKRKPPAEAAPLPDFEHALASLFGSKPGDTPLAQAQELIFQAREIPNPAKRIALANQALKICPDCADAYLLLLEDKARGPEQHIDMITQAVTAGERALGPETFQEATGHFWGVVETRPYMRARLALAIALWGFGEHTAAIEHAQELLRLNPNDNQGVRSLLLDWLLHRGKLDDAKALWKRYAEDASGHWQWARALMAFIEHGDGAKTNKWLVKAIEANPHVPDYLLGRTALPEQEPEYIGLGDINEAVAYLLDSNALWHQTEGALGWLSRKVPANSRSGK